VKVVPGFAADITKKGVGAKYIASIPREFGINVTIDVTLT
tara:strand:+ start:1071 stop:1190 length:120 start_codon:yes stop_codon:yes gene_type:complete